ncbi:putative hydrolase C777.06c [Diospyros lotus]|uniref:putative hydrolase C777.06c n=1 Tax=Diospyros lotus TaxID=55363 RepID=UPI002254DBA4|nr:putative hydrolase C777.06c [Diospyros lotus]
MDVSGVVAENAPAKPRSTLIFLGTGCSGGIPIATCLLQPTDPPCHVCSQSLSVPPERNPNYRCNTSLLIDYCPIEGEDNYILIDVGKTFREQVLRWFTFYKIPRVDSIVLTHDHADAVLGLDDIRSVQRFCPTNGIAPIPIYLSQETMDSVGAKFPYLLKKKDQEGRFARRVAQLDWKIIENDCKKPFVASGLELVPLPVMHGEDYVSLGFLFGQKCKVAYISDVSRILPTTEQYISKSSGQRLDLLILDTLSKKDFHTVHLGLPQTFDILKKLCPKRALLVGMNHEVDHYKDNELLREWSAREGIYVQFAHDGLRVPIDL